MTRLVTTGRLEVAYEEEGKGDPVLLLHGGLSTGHAWSGVIP